MKNEAILRQAIEKAVSNGWNEKLPVVIEVLERCKNIPTFMESMIYRTIFDNEQNKNNKI